MKFLLLCAVLLLFCGTVSGEEIIENPEAGYWSYTSQTLQIVIERRCSSEPDRRWYVADIRTQEPWYLALAQENTHIRLNTWPDLVAQRNGVVFAVNNDFAQYRYPKKNSSVGIMIRDGKILSDKTKSTKGKRSFPPLDTLAFLPDGTWAVFESDEHTAQEYLDMGCEHVFSFGPILLRDGVRNKEGLVQYGTKNQPRTCVGMVSPGHFICIVMEGRCKQSKGADLSYMTDLLEAEGCQEAINLDGGETSCMLFMGKQLNVVGGTNNKWGRARRTSELISIGKSDQAEQP